MNFPQMLCDLCIIQLNVAYNFKRLAIENDKKLDQFVIEKGLQSGFTPPRSTALNHVQHQFQQTLLPSPIQIKTETDTDTISEITICTNTDTETFNPTNNFTEQSASTSGSDPSFDNQSFQMVQLSNQIIQTHTHTDIDFINNYMPADSSRRTISVNTTKKGIFLAKRKHVAEKKNNANPNTSSDKLRRVILNLSMDLVGAPKPSAQKLRKRSEIKYNATSTRKPKKNFKRSDKISRATVLSTKP